MKRRINAEDAPPAIGPYSQAVEAGGFVFCSGQIPLDKTGAMVDGGIEQQTRRVLTNISSVLLAAGLSMSDVVKTTVFMRDLSHFAEMNAVYQEFFASEPPARTTVEVSSLPKGALVEIDAVAARAAPRPKGESSNA